MLRDTGIVLRGFRLLIVVFGVVMITVYERSHEPSGAVSTGVFLCSSSMLLLMAVTVVVSRRWARGRDKALNEVLERYFDFDWYGRYLDALIARRGSPRQLRRSAVAYWVGRAEIAYVRGDFDGVFACLAHVDARSIRFRGCFKLGLATYILGCYAALYAGNGEMTLRYFTALTRYPVRGRKRIQLRDRLLGALSERAGMLHGDVPGSMSQSPAELGEGYTPFARMDQAYVVGLAEYARGNVAHAEELMHRIVELGQANPEIYLVRQAQARLHGGATSPVSVPPVVDADNGSMSSSDVRVPGLPVVPATRSGWNHMAVAGFVLSFPLWIVGIVLCVIGLVQTGRRGGRGRGLAIAGIVVSLVMAAITISRVDTWVRDGCVPSYSASDPVPERPAAQDVERLLEKTGAYPKQSRLCTLFTPHVATAIGAHGNTLMIGYTMRNETAVTQKLVDGADRQLRDNDFWYRGEAADYAPLVRDRDVRVVVTYRTGTGALIATRTYTPLYRIYNSPPSK